MPRLWTFYRSRTTTTTTATAVAAVTVITSVDVPAISIWPLLKFRRRFSFLPPCSSRYRDEGNRAHSSWTMWQPNRCQG